MHSRNRINNGLILALLLSLCVTWPLQAQDRKDSPPLQKAYLFWQQGYALHLFGKYDEAIELFGKSIDVHPTAEAYTFRGWSLSMLGRLKEAIGECKGSHSVGSGLR